jgi:hypothetical protein
MIAIAAERQGSRLAHDLFIVAMSLAGQATAGGVVGRAAAPLSDAGRRSVGSWWTPRQRCKPDEI